MNNRPNGPVWAKPCPDTLINRTAAAVTVLAPIIATTASAGDTTEGAAA